MITVENLKTIIDFNRLKKLFETYCLATGLSVRLYSANGDNLLSVSAEGCICDFVKDKSVCKNKLVYSGAKSAELGKPYIFETACNLIACATPLVIEENFVGFIVTGPVSLWGREDFIEEDFLSSCKCVGVDTENPKFKLSSIKTVDCQTMTGLADMLQMMLDYMVEKEINLRRERDENAVAFAELNQKLETVSDESRKLNEKYPDETERKLITSVRLGDKDQSKALMNEFLSEIIFYAGGDLSVFKVKLYEVMAFFSRTAVEAGARIKDISNIVTKSSGLLHENIDFQGTCVLATEILDEYLDVVCKTKTKSPKTHVTAIVNLINQEYGNPELSLKTVAAKMYLNSFYVSHLFKAELGMTFVDYLTQLRIEKAKALLNEGKNCYEVAELVGFKDSSYFNKVFKKIVGVSAAKYRRP